MVTENFQPIIEAKGLNVTFGDRPILQDLCFEIKPGKMTILFGKNGVGKTTLQRVLCGLLKPNDGTFRITGKDGHSLSRRDFAKLVSYVPQSYQPPFQYSVLDFVMMGRAPYGGIAFHPGEKDREMALAMLERVGKLSLTHHSYSTLSTGERQLVLLARGLVQNTPIILMDEPIANLDFANQYHVMDIVKDLMEKDGKTILITLHDPHISLEYADEFLILFGPQESLQFSREDPDYLDTACKAFSRVYNKEICIHPVENHYFAVMK